MKKDSKKRQKRFEYWERKVDRIESQSNAIRIMIDDKIAYSLFIFIPVYTSTSNELLIRKLYPLFLALYN